MIGTVASVSKGVHVSLGVTGAAKHNDSSMSATQNPSHLFAANFTAQNSRQDHGEHPAWSFSAWCHLTVKCRGTVTFVKEPVTCSASAKGGLPPYKFVWSAKSSKTPTVKGVSLSAAYKKKGQYVVTAAETDSNGQTTKTAVDVAVDNQTEPFSRSCRERSHAASVLPAVQSPAPQPAGAATGTISGRIFRQNAGSVLQPPPDTFTRIATSPQALTVPAGCTRTEPSPARGSNDMGEADPPSGTYTDVAMGQKFGCALTAAGVPVCWGADDSGQTSPPANVTFTQITAGAFMPAALLRRIPLSVGVQPKRDGSGSPTGAFSQVSIGGNYACGLQTDGTIACSEPAGNGEGPPAGTFMDVSVSDEFACALQSDGQAVCWRRGGYGVDNVPDANFVEIYAGQDFACGLTAGGSTLCWGGDDFGQLLPPQAPYTQVAAGDDFSCGLQSSGSVVCWGQNPDGQLNPPSGQSTQSLPATPSPVAWILRGWRRAGERRTPVRERFPKFR